MMAPKVTHRQRSVAHVIGLGLTPLQLYGLVLVSVAIVLQTGSAPVTSRELTAVAYAHIVHNDTNASGKLNMSFYYIQPTRSPSAPQYNATDSGIRSSSISKPGSAAENISSLGARASAEQVVAAFAGTDNIKMADRLAVQHKLEAIIRGGPSKLAIVSDWDRTITKGTSLSSHGVVDRISGLRTGCSDTMKANTKKYLPIEQDPDLTIEQKLPHMRDWYRLNHNAFVDCGITRGMLQNATRTLIGEGDGTLQVRSGATHTMSLASWLGIPFIIFSAGLTDVIEMALGAELHTNQDWRNTTPVSSVINRGNFSGTSPNTTIDNSLNIVSNKMQWSTDDRNGVLTGFSEPLIHMFNKDQSQVPAHLQPVVSRPHVLLLGDGLGDAAMIDGNREPPAHVLRVGFLNYQDPEPYIDKYTTAFDIVLLGDRSMAPINDIIRASALNAKPL